MGPWLEVLVAVAMIVGLVGVVVPVLPGLLVSWLAVLGWAVLDGGGWVRWATVVVVGAVGAVGYLASTLIPGKRTAQTGAPDWVVLVGAVGMVVGFFVIPVVGLVVGGVAGVWLAELARTRDARRAWQVTVATLKGFGLAAAVQLLAGMAMIGCWLLGVLLS